MNYKLILIIFFPLLLIGCDQTFNIKNENLDLLRNDKYKNSGFALIYNDKLENMEETTSFYIKFNPEKQKWSWLVELVGEEIQDLFNVDAAFGDVWGELWPEDIFLNIINLNLLLNEIDVFLQKLLKQYGFNPVSYTHLTLPTTPYV